MTSIWSRLLLQSLRFLDKNLTGNTRRPSGPWPNRPNIEDTCGHDALRRKFVGIWKFKYVDSFAGKCALAQDASINKNTNEAQEYTIAVEDTFIVGRCNIDTVQWRVEVFYGSSQLGDDNNKVEMNAIVAS